MSISSSTLTAIQKAGAAAFSADEKLKKATQDYAARVHAAIAANPYHLGNDALIENWKTVARLSQTLAGIEAEIKKVFQVASELTGEDQPSVVTAPALAAPAPVAKKAAAKQASKAKKSKPAKRAAAAVVPSTPVVKDLAPTDVVIKSKKKAVAPKAKASPAKRATTSAKPQALSGNSATLMAKLERVLNASEFTKISQTALSQELGIALGSMTAAIKKLLASGHIKAGPTGSYMLAKAAPSATPGSIAN